MGAVTVSVAVIAGGTTSGELFAARGLGVLPRLSVGDPARRDCGRCVGEHATWGRRASVVKHEKYIFARSGVSANVIGGENRNSARFLNGHPGTINPCAVSATR